MVLKVYGDAVVMTSRIISILPYDSQAGKAKVRLVDEADKCGKLIDACMNNAARSLIVLDSGHIMITPVASESLWKRLTA